MEVTKVGTIKFSNRLLDVYSSLEEPLFRASDIANMIDYSSGNTWSMLNMCEDDEKLNLPMVVAGQRRNVSFVTETGLYNILSQSRMKLARLWRRIIHTELIEMRKSHGRNIKEQFDEWDHRIDDYYFDEDTGRMMMSVTVAGGDVVQVPVDQTVAEDPF